MAKRMLLGLAAVAAVAWAVVLAFDEQRARPALPVVAPAPPPPPTGAPAPAPVPSLEAAPLPPVTFEAGFCSTTAGTETIELRYGLQRLLTAEVRRRLAADGGEPFAQADLAVLRDALKPNKPAGLMQAAEQAAARAPEEAWPQVVIASVAHATGQADAEVLALRRARQRLPNDPALGWAIAEATRDSADLDEALEGLSVYLASDPAPAVARLRSRLEVQRDLQRDYRRQVRNGISVLWPAEVLTNRQADELAVAVDRGLDEAAKFTGTQRRPRLTVVVYPGRSELLAVSCARSWTAALYDGSLRVVAAANPEGYDGRVLRHEVLHAQLAPLAPRAPKWFHEGVAQSFARESKAWRKWALMVRNRVWVPFSSLDGSFQVFDSDSDADLAYAQSLAMVELMLEWGGQGAVADALTAFQAGADTPTAFSRACRGRELDGKALLSFLEQRLAQRTEKP